MAGAVPLSIFIASLCVRGSGWKLGGFDYACGVFALLTLSLWLITGNPLLTVILGVATDALAAPPTIRKTWHHPDTETPGVCAMAGIAALFALITLPSWDPVLYLFPLYLVIVDSLMLYEIFFSPHRQKPTIRTSP